MIKDGLWSILNYDHGLIESQPRMEMLEIMMKEIITKVKLMLGKKHRKPKDYVTNWDNEDDHYDRVVFVVICYLFPCLSFMFCIHNSCL